ncbi:hypothetical protein D4Q71_09055, partial [Rhodopseudomonas palustris]
GGPAPPLHNGTPSLGRPHPSPLPQAGEGARRRKGRWCDQHRRSGRLQHRSIRHLHHHPHAALLPGAMPR